MPLTVQNDNICSKVTPRADTGKKRKDSAVKTSTVAKKAKKESRAEAEAWVRLVMATDAETDVVYDSCTVLKQNIKKCLEDHPGLTKATFCKVALQGCNNNALARFLKSHGQDQQGNQVYPRAYTFFEKLRVMNGEKKTKTRLKNEKERQPSGFSTRSTKIGRPPTEYYNPLLASMGYH